MSTAPNSNLSLIASSLFVEWLKGALMLGRLTTLDSAQYADVTARLAAVLNAPAPSDCSSKDYSFCVWLSGYLEGLGQPDLTMPQLHKIKEHLSILMSAQSKYPSASEPGATAPFGTSELVRC